jgi:hypothetical protein
MNYPTAAERDGVAPNGWLTSKTNGSVQPGSGDPAVFGLRFDTELSNPGYIEPLSGSMH